MVGVSGAVGPAGLIAPRVTGDRLGLTLSDDTEASVSFALMLESTFA